MSSRKHFVAAYGFQPLLMRSDLVKSGGFKTVKDLRGMTVAGNADGSR